MLTKNYVTMQKVSKISLISFILMLINIINVLLNKYCLNDLIWYTEGENVFLMTLIKCIFYSIVPFLVFFGIKNKKEKLVLFSSFIFLLANSFMLLFKDVSNYIFSFVFGALGIISSIFLFLSVTSTMKNKNKSKATNILASLLNTIMIVFTFVTFTVVIPVGIVDFLESIEYIFYLGLGYSGFSFFYYLLQGMYLILILNAFNLLLFDSCEDNEIGTENFEAGYSNIAKHILMPFCTLGLYYIGWIYRITKCSEYNNSQSNQSKAVEAVFLNLFIPFYSIYWHYKISKNIELLFEAKGKKNQNFSALIIILSIFAPFVAYIVLQSKLNEAIKCATEQINIPVYQEQNATYENNTKNYVDEIKSLKDLLDMGAITPEEFAEKKKQLLNLP